MKKTGLFLVFWAVVVIGSTFAAMGFLTGCTIGNGHVTSQERAAAGFEGVVLNGAGNVYVYPAENYRVMVNTDSNLQHYIVTRVNNNTLYIDQKTTGNFNPTKLTIDVYLPALEAVTLKGAGNIKIGKGSAPDLRLSLSGAGNIDAQNYEVENVNVSHSGAGNVKTWATKSLTGRLSGVGNILYKGTPATDVRKSGVGAVKRL